MSSIDERVDDRSRRSFIKKMAYVAPTILTLKAVPAFASQGSTRSDDGGGDGVDPQPQGNSPVSDGPGTGPGNPAHSSGRRRSPRRRWWWWLVPTNI